MIRSKERDYLVYHSVCKCSWVMKSLFAIYYLERAFNQCITKNRGQKGKEEDQLSTSTRGGSEPLPQGEKAV